MTTHTPLARYSATNGALVSGFATAELHHLMGHDPCRSWRLCCGAGWLLSTGGFFLAVCPYR